MSPPQEFSKCDNECASTSRGIYEAGIERASVAYVLFENTLIAAQLLLGAYLLLPLGVFGIPVVTIAYGLFALVMLAFVLRKQLCTGCFYYGRMCHCGWGRLAAKLYPKDSGNHALGGKLAGMTWGLLMMAPVLGWLAAWLLGIISLAQQLPVLVPFVVVSGVNLGLHVHDCRQCKMRYICPGSAAKG
jgi:hypothetical protein